MLPDDHVADPRRKLSRFYQTHHCPQSRQNPSTGVTIMVRVGIPMTPVIANIGGRIAAVDVTLPDVANRPRQLRIIGVYAPTAPISTRNSSNLTTFWQDVHSVLPQSHDWILIGDFNAYLHPWEARGGTDETAYVGVINKLREAYRAFLSASRGKDVWENNMTTAAARDWTCVGHSSKSAIKILD